MHANRYGEKKRETTNRLTSSWQVMCILVSKQSRTQRSKQDGKDGSMHDN